MSKNLEELKNDLKSYRSCIKIYQSDGYDISYDIEDFVQHGINLFEDFEKRLKVVEAELGIYTEEEIRNIKVGLTDPN